MLLCSLYFFKSHLVLSCLRNVVLCADAEEEDEWSKDKETVWDSIEGSSTGMGGMGLGGDLADFAAAALKFRADTSALYGLKGEVKEEVREWRRCVCRMLIPCI